MGQAQGKEFPYSADNKLQSPQGTELYSYHSGKCSVSKNAKKKTLLEM